MDKFAVLQQGFERLSYQLGKYDPCDKLSFSEGNEKFVLHRVQSETQAEMAVGASDFIEKHASSPVGYVASEKGEFFLVCKSGAKGGAAARKEFSSAVVSRLAALHTLGFGCGGISPSAVEFSKGEALLSDPSKIYALSDSDPLFYEAVSTLRALVSKGYAAKSSLRRLAGEYVSHSPVCRHAVRQHMEKKGLNGSPASVLASTAERFAAYF